MERITVHYAIVRNAYCESRSTVTARTHEELWAKILDGQRCLIYGDVLETGTREEWDPEAYEAARQERLRIEQNSCLLPPPGDLLLLRKAKDTDPDDWESIDPQQGSWKETRRKLEIIRNAKYNLTIQPIV